MVETMLAEEELTEVNERLAAATPTEILQWAVERFFPRLTMATAFGPEGCILIHMLSEIGAQVRIFNLDTGYQFPETLALRERIMDRYGIDVELVSADVGEGLRDDSRRTALRDKFRAVLLRAEDRAAPPGAGGLRLVAHGHPGRSICASGEGQRGGLGLEVQPGQG